MFQKGLFIDEPKVNLEMRRQVILRPEWDYEWDSSKGVLNNNDFIRTSVGSGGNTTNTKISGTYMQFLANSSNYFNYTYPNVYNTGVMEAEIYTANQAIFTLTFGNGIYGVGIRLQTSTNYKGVYLGTALSEKLVSATYDTKYKVRLVLKKDTADIYVNDVLLAQNTDVTDLTTCQSILVRPYASGGTNRYTRLYSLKMKFNRI